MRDSITNHKTVILKIGRRPQHEGFCVSRNPVNPVLFRFAQNSAEDASLRQGLRPSELVDAQEL